MAGLYWTASLAHVIQDCVHQLERGRRGGGGGGGGGENEEEDSEGWSIILVQKPQPLSSLGTCNSVTPERRCAHPADDGQTSQKQLYRVAHFFSGVTHFLLSWHMMQPLYVRQCIAESTHKNNSHTYIVHDIVQT